MFEVEFDTDNAAFEDDAGQEIARILAKIAGQVTDGHTFGKIFDSNGNTCGEWSYDPYEPQENEA